jgi:hypothetical protein
MAMGRVMGPEQPDPQTAGPSGLGDPSKTVPEEVSNFGPLSLVVSASGPADATSIEGRAAELWRVPPSETGAATDGVRAQTTAAEVGSETVGDGETAFLAGPAAGRMPERVPLLVFTGTGDDGGPASSQALF